MGETIPLKKEDYEVGEHTWLEFFLEPVPLTLCLLNIFYALGFHETAKVVLFVTSPFILAFFHSLYERIRYGKYWEA